MKFFKVLGCIVLLAMLGCGGSSGEGSKLGSVFPEIDSPSTPAVSVPGRSGKISGFVYDYNNSGIVMEGVNVKLYTSAGSELTSQTSDSNGYYIFKGFASGSYKVCFSKEGYADVWYDKASSEATATPVPVTSPNTTVGINGFMGNGSRITGRVTDASGITMSGVIAKLYTSTGSILTSQSTVAGGDYTFTGFAPGAYKISFSKPGYVDVLKSGVTIVTSPSTISVGDVKMGDGSTIIGRVIDVSSGLPLKEVSANVFSSADPGSGIASQSTATDGNFSVAGFLPGTYEISFSKPGYVDVRTIGVAIVTSPSTLNIGDIKMGDGATISGRVTDASGNPLNEVSVNVFFSTDTASSIAFQSTTDGNYTLRGFASGTYKVRFSKAGYADVWYGGDVTVASSSPISVGDVKMGVGGKITGNVIDSVPVVPVNKISVTLYKSDDSFLTSQTIDSSGNYTFYGFASGAYKVRFSKSGYADVWYNSAGDKATATAVPVISPDTTSGINGVM